MHHSESPMIASERLTLDYIRIFACLCIYLCHIFEIGTSFIFSLGTQFFNVGVALFFMLSGYLYSGKKLNQSAVRWYQKKILRLGIPVWIFMVIFIPILIGIGIIPSVSQILYNLFLLSGLSQQYIPRCGHLWFITHILICYLVTPFLMRFRPCKHTILFVCTYLAVKIIAAYSIPTILSTLISSLGSFLVGFYLLPIMLSNYRKLIILFPVSIILRIVFFYFFDGSILYSLFLVDISHKMLAISIIAIFNLLGQYLSRVSLLNQITEKFKPLTYAFYIVHYPIVLSLASVPRMKNVFLIGILGLIVSLFAAICLHSITNSVNKLIKEQLP